LTKTPRRAGGIGRLLAALVLSLPLLALPFATRALVDRSAAALGAELADTLDHAFDWRTPDEPNTPTLVPTPLDLGLDLPIVPGIEVLHAPAAPESGARSLDRKGLSTRTPALRGGVHVRAEVVARAVQSGARPSGVPVPALGLRPAGIALQGVSGFGAGLRDGDVLTRIGGAPATSVGVVVGAIAGALQHGAKVITGEVWRGDQRLAVAVEVPRSAQPVPRRARPKPRAPARALPFSP
jgi:hypothetical protein